MKKANALFALIIAVTVFTLSFFQFNEHYAKKVKDFSDFTKDPDSYTRVFVILDMSHNYEGVETLFHRVNDIVANYDYDMFIYEIVNNRTGAISDNYYIRHDSIPKYFDTIYLQAKQHEDARNPLSVTNNLEKSANYTIDYLDKDYYSFSSNYMLRLENASQNHEVNAYDFEAMPLYASKDATYYRLFMDIPNSDLEKVKSDLQRGLWMYADVKTHFNENDTLAIHEFDVNSVDAVRETVHSPLILDPFIMASIVIIGVLIAYHYFENRKKEIAVRLILGKSRISILNHVYGQYLLNFTVFYILGFMASWAMYVRSLRPIAIEFTSIVIKQSLIAYFAVFATSLLFAILTTAMTDFSNIKRIKKTVFPLIIITGIRISVAALLISSILTSSLSFMKDYANYRNIKNNTELTRRYVLGYYDKFVARIDSKNEKLNQDLEKNLIAIFEKHHGEYSNSSIYEEKIESYNNYLAKNPGLPADRHPWILDAALSPLPSGIPTIFVNDAYLNSFEFTDLKGNAIDLSEASKMVLIPKNFKGDFNQQKIIGEEDIAIYHYQNKSVHFGNISKIIARYDNPIIVKLPNSSYINSENSLFSNHKFNAWFVSNDIISNQRFNEDLKLNGLDGSIQMESYQQAETLMVDSMKRSFTNYLHRTLLTLIYITIYIFTICTVFVDYKRKQLTIEYMMGKSRWHRYQIVLGMVFISNLVSLYYFKFSGYELLIACLICCVELGVSFIYMMLLEKKYAIALIKGGDV